MTAVLCGREDCYRGSLILVNRQYPIHSAGLLKKEDFVCADEAYPQVRMERQAARVLRKAFEELGCGGAIALVSGYRTRAEQETIYRDSLEENGPEFTGKYVALPDRSEHQTGLAIDLGDGSCELDFIRPEFPSEGMCGRFRRAAARYGYVLRYPAGRESITGIAHEPWHFRYVGYPHSLIMEEQGMVLEEYLDFLASRPEGMFEWHHEGCSMEIRYVKRQEPVTRILIPEECLYQISGDNRDGFVVTVWRKW